MTAIAQDEPLDATGDGATCPDGVGVGIDAVSLRSERSGRGDGRVYHVAFEAVDVCGAPCVGRSPSACRTTGATATLRRRRATVRCDARRRGAVDGQLRLTDCVPEPDDVEACDGDPVPGSVTARLDRAKKLLGKGGKGKGRARAAERSWPRPRGARSTRRRKGRSRTVVRPRSCARSRAPATAAATTTAATAAATTAATVAATTAAATTTSLCPGDLWACALRA